MSCQLENIGTSFAASRVANWLETQCSCWVCCLLLGLLPSLLRPSSLYLQPAAIIADQPSDRRCACSSNKLSSARTPLLRCWRAAKQC